ncbi:MAG: hypothetical protein IIW14_03245 [Kiritimatiellae bacterium]|jgi:hypothetical protein|nr:hypothetical protein [Kiritimatiellia bacterium]
MINSILAVLAAVYLAVPDADHTAQKRRHTGIPSIAVSAGGRLWATWYGSNTGGEDSNNYCTLATSSDGGISWKEVRDHLKRQSDCRATRSSIQGATPSFVIENASTDGLFACLAYIK